MLRHLHIRNLALIEESTLDFHPGMTVLTGETGAGKSMILEALSLLTGTRATPSLVRTGTERATVEAAFDLPAAGRLAGLLAERGLEGEEELIIRREVQASGRSRASVNGRLVPLAQLQEIASELLDVGAQHEQIALLDPARQGELFDDFAQVAPQKRAVEHAFSEVRRLEHEIAAGNRADSEREQRRDFLRFRIQELESASLQPGEKEKLEAELQRLSHHERLVEFLSASLQALSENPDGGAVATDLIARAMGSVESSSRLDPSLAPLIDQLAQAHSLISEAAYEIGRYLNKADVDPGRVDEVIARLELLKKVLRRHGPTEQEALSALGLMQEELHRLEDWEAMRDGLAKEHATALQRLQAAAGELRNARLQQAPGFQRPLVAILKDFAMPKVRFEVAFTPCTEGVALGEGSHCRATGTEEVEFLFSANEGEPLLPLRRTASGGELSRLLLALRTITAQPEASPLMVFDEVDAGVSGAAARAVAQRLAALGSRTQILCVTHNASVAAAAQNHVLVEKETIEGRTLSRARLLAMESRRSELARLLEGGVQSGLGLALADQLLSGAAG